MLRQCLLFSCLQVLCYHVVVVDVSYKVNNFAIIKIFVEKSVPCSISVYFERCVIHAFTELVKVRFGGLVMF